ncbi:cysteine dioxygenase family protein [Micromonospora sp. WMMA1949]|uniref:cysteine dioxygenase n=1 Tax=unclassified Micromonospora TaxID=2617518 RepID=UPI0022B605F6|nr:MULTISPECIES: cysteine dioxygenase family protein [unclassified Micromonospora]MCZ7429677.1 cysteine dioxygenase family protein [Micromonospora sp. WMMA1949]WBC08532.1 cysteine dioxygenase family protein [Micromonospora sp. WMMA1947]
MTSTVPADLLAVAARWADPDAWPVPLRFEAPDRWYARLDAGDEHEVWALSWLPGQGTDLHDHGGSAGAFLVVAGVLTEETVGGGRLRPHRLAAGAGRRFGARHVHRVANRGDVPAVSVHVYRPALTRMTRYHLVAGRLRVAEVARAGVAW